MIELKKKLSPAWVQPPAASVFYQLDSKILSSLLPQLTDSQYFLTVWNMSKGLKTAVIDPLLKSSLDATVLNISTRIKPAILE